MHAARISGEGLVEELQNAPDLGIQQLVEICRFTSEDPIKTLFYTVIGLHFDTTLIDVARIYELRTKCPTIDRSLIARIIKTNRVQIRDAIRVAGASESVYGYSLAPSSEVCSSCLDTLHPFPIA